ncbi:hypothetical protein SEA_STROSAHL_40 [Gordonia phage Strosahl]|uniref:Uncharacterized protein n=2 Tax=Soupsvirus strosahl TaxID=2560510 RepID=A0A1B3B175_9CAUD|nr:hypothetical protein BIZ67_gp070 [Gordonia phage Remus]YP_009596241.1 hypothetical protein FDH03_gp070 [Gordonia phage Strosahl]AOE44650.1 hypothetical protein SEA_REMUS_40 [Gordonia phage Remus]AOE44751.1 hypothetical protein SEA_STROSAHL_40 [Gordonia phage Strosahl]
MRNGAISICKDCDRAIMYIEYSQWNGFEYEVLDAWWNHFTPLVGHEGDPRKLFLPETY